MNQKTRITEDSLHGLNNCWLSKHKRLPVGDMWNLKTKHRPCDIILEFASVYGGQFCVLQDEIWFSSNLQMYISSETLLSFHLLLFLIFSYPQDNWVQVFCVLVVYTFLWSVFLFPIQFFSLKLLFVFKLWNGGNILSQFLSRFFKLGNGFHLLPF